MRGILPLLVISLLAATAPGVPAVPVDSWSIGSPEDFALGTLEGTAVDRDGLVTVALTAETLWGPEDGIVWDVEPDGAGGVFVAVSSPTRVIRVSPGHEPESWHATGDESLVAAILPDSQGGLYMALSPDGRLMHLSGPGSSREVADSEALFIWALAASEDGSVWIGTGLPGRLLRVTPDGELEAVFESGDDPVRCIAALEGGGVVFGTGGRGRVVRVDASGRPFVLFDSEETEIVALEVAPSGVVYVLTAHGSKQIAAARTAASAAAHATVRVTASAPPDPNGEDQDDTGDQDRREAPARREPPRRFSTPPGGALYRITPDGDHQRIWQGANEVPFSLERREDGLLFVATGDKGRIHAVDDAGRSSILLQIPSDQASALGRSADGTLIVGGTTDARVERIGPGPRSVGGYVSSVHDAGALADWGRVGWDVDQPAGSEVRAAVRVGNTAEPDETWTEWTLLAAAGPTGAETALPATRFIQLRLELEPSRRAESPRVRQVELFYQPRNRRPTITDLTVQPAGVVWTKTATPTGRPTGPLVAEDPVTRKTLSELKPAVATKPVRKSYELGARTLSWGAEDPDRDRLTYRIDVRREGTPSWIPLAVDVEDPFFGWDTRGMSDGLYRARLTAADGRDNPGGKGLSDSRISAAFWVDNTRPSVGSPNVERTGERYEVEFVATDPGGNVVAAEVSVDTGAWQPLEPLDGVADSEEERYQLVIEPLETPLDDEPRTVKVRVTDSAGNMGGDAWALGDEE